MENKYRFGKIDVNCEGYDYPTDLYILRGSCGLEYTIELTDEGRAKQGSSDYHGRNNYQYGSRNRYNNSSALREVVMFVIVAVIFYMVFKTCTSNRHIYPLCVCNELGRDIKNYHEAQVVSFAEGVVTQTDTLII
ncbi:store-operated calcium entry-associated regulatory factor-like [Paramuricea clavata]|uniref:Store-operated calcium entry-associated regulatory factor n=1 Tax=Paramuricea clavata TaxID=317549 RepID=A0A7D9LSF7_PARCT|nr:store-operated calcium entry-associated regulatory factor-like [Paramuricea clavata]